jgi:hypothetical protein
LTAGTFQIFVVSMLAPLFCLFRHELGDEPVFHPLPRPRRLAQKCEAGLDRGIELKTADGNAPPHFAPTMPLDKLIENVFQRDAV